MNSISNYNDPLATPLDLERLRTFVVAAETLNYTQAARRLRLSQPAISQQIHELEEDLGLALFARRGRGLALTPAGEALVPHAQHLLGEARRVSDALDAFRGVPQGSMLLGAEPTPGVYLLPRILGELTQRHPALKSSLHVMEGESLWPRLRTGALDLAVVETPPAPGQLSGWHAERCFEDELVVIAPPSHPWAERGTIHPDELAGEALILRQPDAALRRGYAQQLAAAGFAPDRLSARFELSSSEGIKHAVMAGLGAGIVPLLSLEVELEAGRLKVVRLDGLKLSLPYYLLRPEKRPLNVFQQMLVDRLLSSPEGPAC
ncbi:LysR family transcriptional regulator [bacterium]|nr:LysR family transcriptional regulator [bacterium]